MTRERWHSFLKSQQLLMVGSEIMRAKVWQNEEREKFRSAIERALALIDLTLEDPKWHDRLYMLLWLRQEFARHYVGSATADIGILYNAL